MKKLVVTHNKIIHADEVMAIALLRVFTNDEIVVSRVSHDTTDFSVYDMVIDIGKKFDGVKYFDHHQYKGGKSSAGLIWDYLGLGSKYSKISKLINLIDMNDVGTAKAKEFEFSSLIKSFNIKDINSKEQDEQFEKAVEFSMTVIKSMKESQEDKAYAQEIVKNSYLFDRNPKIVELDEFTPHWTTYINGEVTPHVKAVVWEDEEENNWKVKIPSKRLGTFELHGKALIQDKTMEFVHSSGHFAIAKNRDIMVKYLRKCI